MLGKKSFTLVSLNQAKEGFTFLHKGSSPKCDGCKYFLICVKNLETGRVYRVTGLRDKKMRCELADTDMMVVEVVESEIEAAVLCKQAIEGAIILFQTRECSVEDCENLTRCSPRGLLNGDRCEVVKVTGSLRCAQGLPLAGVVLQRVQAS